MTYVYVNIRVAPIIGSVIGIGLISRHFNRIGDRYFDRSPYRMHRLRHNRGQCHARLV